MKPLFTFLCLFLFTQTAFAFKCTKWTQTRSTTCVFAGQSSNVWERQCENPCGWRDFGPHCDVERLCHPQDPNLFSSSCSEWTKLSGTTCRNPNTGDWEQKWERACQTGLATSWCSDEDPNN